MATLSIPATAMAAPVTGTTSQSTNLGCAFLETDGASAYLYHAAAGENGGAWLEIWLAPANPIVDPPTLISADASLVLSADGTTLSGPIDLVFAEGWSSAGAAGLVATLTPIGPVETNQRSTTNGNQKVHVVETLQALSISGTLTLPSAEVFELDGVCWGDSVITETTQNNPRSEVKWATGTGVLCDWYLDDGSYVGLMGQGERTLTWIDIAVVTPDGSFLGSDENATLDRTGLKASVQLVGGGQGIAATGGSAYADARVHNGQRTTYSEGSGSSRTRITVQEFVVEGTLSVWLDDGTSLSLDMGACRMVGGSERLIQGGNG